MAKSAVGKTRSSPKKAIADEKARAHEIVNRVRRRSRRFEKARKTDVSMKAKKRPGILVAEGDSWFDYPGTDILEVLEDRYGYDVKSVAHRGDTVESMAYGPKQLDRLARELWKLGRAGKVPQAVLLSGGGNDIAGEEFPLLLNHARAGLPALNDDIVRGLVEVRLREALASLARTVTGLCREIFEPPKPIPILVHGYDYPVPDGRGYRGGWGPLPGPWLKPGFDDRGYPDLPTNTATLETLINRFNRMLSALPRLRGLAHLKYVNLRGTLSNTLPRLYKQWWDNELHPEERGFELIAGRFRAALP